MNHFPFSDTGVTCGLVSRRALHLGVFFKTKHGQKVVQSKRAHLAWIVAQKRAELDIL